MLSVIEAIYLFYMFHCFETTIDFGITPSPNGYWFTHMTGNEKGLRICPFGRVAIPFFNCYFINTSKISSRFSYHRLFSLTYQFKCAGLSTSSVYYRIL